MKKVLNEEGIAKIKTGIDLVADNVKTTQGPRGKNKIIDRGWGVPITTNDGKTIAENIESDDEFEDMGCRIAKGVSRVANEAAGDGTTTATVLFQALVTEGLKYTATGMNGGLLEKGIQSATTALIERLKDMSKPVENFDEIHQVATISVEDSDIGMIIASAFDSVGKKGVVTVEESNVFGVESEVVQGMELDKGYVSGYMITNLERMEADIKSSPIFITDSVIATEDQVVNLMQAAKQMQFTSLVVICQDLVGEALGSVVLNKMRGAFNLVAIRAPGFGEAQKGNLEDLCIITGATFVTKDLKMDIATDKEIVKKQFGNVDHFTAGKDKSTLVVDNEANQQNIDDRVKYLTSVMDNTESEFEVERLQQRIARLAGGVAVIRVGAATEERLNYLKLKIEDAKNATRAAIEEGIVAGGGTALLLARKGMEVPEGSSPEFVAGYNIVLKAIEAPIRQIVLNANKDDGVVVNKVYESGLGYNAMTDTYEDLVAGGIIDPVKVTRTALYVASEAAGNFLTSDGAIAIPKKNEQNQG